MAHPLNLPGTQRFARFIACRRVRVLRVGQVPLQHRCRRIVRTQRRMPLAAAPPIVPAKREHALSRIGMVFQCSHPLRHLIGSPPLVAARVGQRTQPAAHPQAAHPREQPPQVRLLCRAAHHTGGASAHNSRSSARVSTHGLLRSYGCRKKRWISGRRSIARSVPVSLPRSYSPICNNISTSS